MLLVASRANLLNVKWSAILVVLSFGCRTPPFDLVASPDFARSVVPDLASSPDLNAADLSQRELCPPEALLIYVVDAVTNTLSSFRPDTAAFDDIAVLDCMASAGYTPESMAVQRDGTAWVAYLSRDEMHQLLFRVNVATGVCDPTPHSLMPKPARKFGMAIALDEGEETLYLVAPQAYQTETPAELGVVDLNSFTIAQRGLTEGDGEMTGDVDGSLYAFLPNWLGNGGTTRVVRLDHASATTLQEWSLPALDTYPGSAAIAAWRGSLWLFIGRGPSTDATTAVFQLDPTTGDVTNLVMDTGRHVIGAGVAPCQQ